MSVPEPQPGPPGDPPDRPLPKWVWVLVGVALSVVVHVLLFWPLMADFLGKEGEADPPPDPVEVTWETEPEPMRPRPRPEPPVTRPRAEPPKPAMTPPKDKPPRLQPKARTKPRPKKRLRKKLPPKKNKPKPPPKKKREKIKPLKVKLHRMKMVEQTNRKKEPPPKDAKYLAPDNRDVKVQTRARHTNLQKHSDQTNLRAKARKKIGDLTPQKKNETRLPQKAVRERAGAPRKGPVPRKRPVATKPAQPEQKAQRAGLLAMRNRKRNQDQDVLKPDRTRLSPQGTLSIRRPQLRPQPRPQPKVRRPGARVARKRLKLRLSPQDADRVFGKQWAAEWRKRHQRRGSKGPKSQRWKRIKAAIENYVPEVKVGNQNALKTRAHPYARYIAAMHRKIHPLWGDGFLEDLDRLPAHHGFNDWSRHTKLEIVLDNRGRVVKAGVVKPSGYLPFDVAALDVIFQAEPFGAPPPAIRSPDGRVYLHWGFYRNHRQCGTFNVDPFILSVPPKRHDRANANTGKAHRMGRALRRRGPVPVTGRTSKRGRQAAKQLGATLDPRAKGPAAAWIVGFGAGDANKMLRASALPFKIGKHYARTFKHLRSIYRALIAETAKRTLERGVQLLTAAGLRQRLGTLPRGITPGSGHLYVVARFMKNDLVLVLGKKGGRWYVVGLGR